MKIRESKRAREGEKARHRERMRWDYRDNVNRWREVEAPSGLSTPNGLKDFNRATDNRTDAVFTMLETPS